MVEDGFILFLRLFACKWILWTRLIFHSKMLYFVHDSHQAKKNDIGGSGSCLQSLLRGWLTSHNSSWQRNCWTLERFSSKCHIYPGLEIGVIPPLDRLLTKANELRIPLFLHKAGIFVSLSYLIYPQWT